MLITLSACADCRSLSHNCSYDALFWVRRWTRKDNVLSSKSVVVVPVHENKVHWCLLVALIPERRILYMDSMIGRREYFKPKRAKFLLNVLFAWLVLDAHDKGAVDRILGGSSDKGSSVSSIGLSAFIGKICSTWQHALQWLSEFTGIRRRSQAHAEDGGNSLSSAAGTRTGIVSTAQAAASGWQGIIVQNLPRQSDDSSCGVFMTAFAQLVLTGHTPPYDMSQQDIPAMRRAIGASLLSLSSAPAVHCAQTPFSLPSERQARSWWPK